MKILLLVGAIFALSACASPRIFTNDQVTCTWTKIEELIVCRGDDNGET